jgi:hypothetical protein
VYENRRAEKRSKASSRASVTALNRPRTRERLSPDEIDAQRGSLRWPEVLQASEFDDLRDRLDGLFAQRALRPDEFGLGSENSQLIQETTSEYRKRLKARIRELPSNEYIAGDKFLKGLANVARSDTVEK